MATWTTPRTWVNGEMVTKDLMNTHIRDNFTYLYSGSGARVYNNATITLANTSLSTLSFNSERFDTEAYHDSVNPSRLTAPNAGIYFVGGMVRFAINGTGDRRLILQLNGSTAIGASFVVPPSATYCYCSVFSVWQFATGDYVELQAQQSSGGNLDIASVAAVSPELYMFKV